MCTARAVAGEPRPSSESSKVRWVRGEEIDRYPMHPSMRQRIDHFLAGLPKPYLG